MRAQIEEIVAGKRFSMPQLYQRVWPLLEQHQSVSPHVSGLRTTLGEHYRHMGQAVLRHVFLIELVKLPAIETTKVRARWFEQLRDDPRSCSFDECLTIASDLIRDLATGWLDDSAHAEVFRVCCQHGLLPYEAPIDYGTRPLTGEQPTRIHRQGNLSWVCDETVVRTMRLREYLTTPGQSPDPEFFKKVLDDKIKVKTDLTDRALTGVHKTNREKRWETHPSSVQFASRRECIAIEYVLTTQLCAFDGFPAQTRQVLQDRGILPQDLSTFCCPITLDPISFADFRAELLSPTHGKSNFQVGHLNPLKLDATVDENTGHTADNISWISADGNRIQGSLALDAVRALLRRIAGHYEDRGWT